MHGIIFNNVTIRPMSTEVFNKIRPEMDEFNTEMCKVVSLIGAVVYWALYILAFFFQELLVCSTVYLITAIVMSVLTIILLLLCKQPKHSLVILYCLVFYMSIVAIILGTFYSTYDCAGAYVGLSVLFSVIIFDRPWRVAIFTIFTNLIFILLSFHLKDTFIASVDLCNIVISSTMGHLLFRYRMNTKINMEEVNEIKIKKMEQEHHMQIVLSQIQPHFMFNALSTIQYLCKTDPDVASKATNKFAKYIRKNMDSLNEDEAIPFSEELEHLENYLFIEKLRYGDRIKIKYDIKVTDFKLPVLAIQPLVENAMRHGISKRDEGGIIVVGTYADDENVYVTVADNGVGFDTAIIGRNSDERSHIGIMNVRERVEFMCNGSLKVESEIGRGTKVTICLPIEE